MKKIIQILGLEANSTEEDVIKTIKGILKTRDQADSTSKQLSVDLEAQKDLVTKKETELKECAEKLEKASQFFEKITENVSEASLKTMLGVELSKEDIEEIEKVGRKLMQEHQVEAIYMATDGTPFFAENDANNYCLANGYKVIPVGNTKPE